MRKHEIGHVDSLDPGERIVVQIEGREIAVFNLDGEYHAVLNWCPHQSGPLCEGPVSGTVDASFDRETLETTVEWVKEGEIVACPWHGWEFDIPSGDCLSDHSVSVPTYPVVVEDSHLYVQLQ